MQQDCGLCGSLLEAETRLCPDCHRSIRFVLVPSVGAPIPLLNERNLTFGRDPLCSVRISDRTVSRSHATLRWRVGCPELQDTSRHGTLVNGCPIATRVLGNRDRVRIGGFQFTVVDRALAEGQAQASPNATEAGEFVLLQGRITPGSLAEVVQALAIGGRNGRLYVSGSAGRQGWLAFSKGVPIAARSDSEATGVKAAIAVLATEEGRFVFSDGDPSDPQEICVPLMNLLLEANRRRDEAKEIAAASGRRLQAQAS